MSNEVDALLPGHAPLLAEVRQLIDSARLRVAVTANAELTQLYWQIGQRIHREILQGERAGYGQQVVATLARQLSADYGRSFEEKNLRRMMQFAEAFPDKDIVAALWRQLGWSHFKSLIPLKDPLKRDFYAEMCRVERWSTRMLEKQIQSMLFERTALSRKPEETIRHQIETLRDEDHVSQDVMLKDPYLLDFLGMQDRYLEKDLEDAILREIEHFLLELGAGFTFIARQKRLQIDHRDYYIDLLFYNRKLKRLVAVDLKIGDFDAAYKGQMELYLRWLAKYEQEAGEAPPLGIILCTGKTQEQIELLELDKSSIHVAEYLTVLPSREALQVKLHQSIAIARQRFAPREDE
ncbi:PDDEXK nuclease domain-containing protein [Andreprevotia chitinilytica]|uniref:PDDEXK nuclease domain-containing protein n=1 Tax=Andreprevotia chitinilytica TaxID=396808 RepID=UPI00054E86EE|nr:PDDEXK nuclease domain-containing protein [Andreprevotia chitinilytica]